MVANSTHDHPGGDPDILASHCCEWDANRPLAFPQRIVRLQVGERTVWLSPLTANWLVTRTPVDASLLEALLAGGTPSSVIDSTHTAGERARLGALLGQIAARDYARPSAPPRIRFEPVGRSVYLYTTLACNLACPHCFVQAGPPGVAELQTNAWIAALADLRAGGVEEVTFTGGEVLCHPDWRELLETAHHLGLLVTILTNGTLWREEDVHSVAGLVSEVQVSLDGTNEEMNALVRGQGNYKRAMRTALQFADIGIRTSLAMTPRVEDLAAFEASFPSFLDSLALGERPNLTVRLSSKLLPGREGKVPSIEDQNRYAHFARALTAIENENHKLETFVLNHPPNQGIQNCGFGGLSISPDGSVYPCNRITECQPLGNIRRNPVDELLHCGEQIHERTGVDRVEPCRECVLRYICGGGCRLDDFMCTRCGDLPSRSAHCSLAVLHRCGCSPERRAELVSTLVEATDFLYEFSCD